MPTSSYPWKQQLLRQAEALHEMALPHRRGDVSSVKLEETIVVGFYGIRRLINAFLLSEALVHRPVDMMAYPARRQPNPFVGEAPLETLYDLRAGHPVSHDLLFLCHQVMHNCIFAPYFDASKAVRGIHVTSDHQRKVALYGIELQTIEVLFQRVGSEHQGLPA